MYFRFCKKIHGHCIFEKTRYVQTMYILIQTMYIAKTGSAQTIFHFFAKFRIQCTPPKKGEIQTVYRVCTGNFVKNRSKHCLRTVTNCAYIVYRVCTGFMQWIFAYFGPVFALFAMYRVCILGVCYAYTVYTLCAQCRLGDTCAAITLNCSTFSQKG